MTYLPHLISSACAQCLGRTLVGAFARLCSDLFTGYRPERHYMRGAGPKWCAKHMAGRTEAGPVSAPAFN
jgi:hypothetical protein